jgi:uncharacterized protein
MELVGREKEIKILRHCFEASESKLVAVYGRRRVGKTFFIRSVFENQMVFEIAGLHLGDMADQLKHFCNTFVKNGFAPAHIVKPTSWMGAFDLFGLYLDTLVGDQKKVIFIDEVPWFDTPKSKFLMAFENFWNSYCSKRKDILLIICGSAASWIIKKILKNKGGLHNRVAERIKLDQFTLYECEKFLLQKGIKWSRYDIAQMYLTTGGIPYYLDSIRKGESVSQFIDRACFEENGVLFNEYEELYQSLFSDSYYHHEIVEVLFKSKQGLTRYEIMQKSKMSTGGFLTKALEELQSSGFIQKILPYNANVTKALYKLTDNFTIFYFKFMEVKNKRIVDRWTKTVNTQSWISWSGLAFERLCFSHIKQIIKALGLEVISNTSYTWISKGENAAQIDLLIDRSDGVINVCEIKFSRSKFEIDKAYAGELRRKLDAFSKAKNNKRKNLFLTMITPYSTVNNEYHKELVQSDVVLDDLFVK